MDVSICSKVDLVPHEEVIERRLELPGVEVLTLQAVPTAFEASGEKQKPAGQRQVVADTTS